MGNEENNNYRSNFEKAEEYKNEYQKRANKLTDKDLKEMNDSPWFDSDEMANAYNYRNGPYNEYKHYEKLSEYYETEKKRFNQIDLDYFRNDNGSFLVYRVERPLNNRFGVCLNNSAKKLHHEGVAIGNGKNFLVFDYGKRDNIIDFAFNETNNLKKDWREIQKEGESSKTDEEIKDIFFGKFMEDKFSDRRDYNFVTHNCQDYVKEIIKNLLY